METGETFLLHEEITEICPDCSCDFLNNSCINIDIAGSPMGGCETLTASLPGDCVPDDECLESFEWTLVTTGVNETVITTNPFAVFELLPFGVFGNLADVSVSINLTDGQTCTASTQLTLPCGLGFHGGGGEKDKKSKQFNHNVTFSPNPAKGFIQVQNTDNLNLSVEIFNTDGKQVVLKSINQSSTINTENLINGMYLIQIKNLNTQELISSEKLLITQ